MVLRTVIPWAQIAKEYIRILLKTLALQCVAVRLRPAVEQVPLINDIRKRRSAAVGPPNSRRERFTTELLLLLLLLMLASD